MFYDDAKRVALIREYRKAKAAGDTMLATEISVLLYEVYGWKDQKEARV